MAALCATAAAALAQAAAAAEQTAARAAEQITFPAEFAFGTSTAAYQIEGGWLEGGRGMSIWDAFSHSPGKIRTGETGDVAADHYHRWKADVQLMAQLKLRYYRFSISWSRVLPTGYGTVSEAGVRFYSQLIDELLANGIHPVVTLYHWDLPLALQMESDGWLSEATASAFVQCTPPSASMPGRPEPPAAGYCHRCVSAAVGRIAERRLPCRLSRNACVSSLCACVRTCPLATQTRRSASRDSATASSIGSRSTNLPTTRCATPATHSTALQSVPPSFGCPPKKCHALSTALQSVPSARAPSRWPSVWCAWCRYTATPAASTHPAERCARRASRTSSAITCCSPTRTRSHAIAPSSSRCRRASSRSPSTLIGASRRLSRRQTSTRHSARWSSTWCGGDGGGAEEGGQGGGWGWGGVLACTPSVRPLPPHPTRY